MALLAKVIAHRGAKRLAPENTLAAFKQAKILGASWLEFDVQLSQDKIPIIFHDTHLERTTNGKGLLANTPYQSLKHLDAGSWFSQTYAHEPIPTLKETLIWLQENQMFANIEIKLCCDDTDRLVEETVTAVSQLLKEHQVEETHLLSSFSLSALIKLHKVLPSCKLALLLDQGTWQFYGNHMIEVAYASLQLSALHLDYKLFLIDPKRFDYAAMINCYTINDRKLADRLFTLGVHSIFTDNNKLYKID